MDISLFQLGAQDILRCLVEKYKPKKVIAFGSFGRGEMDQDSDIDLCIIKENLPDSSIDRKIEVYSLLDNREIPVDVVIYRPEEFEKRLALGDPFVRTIIQEGKTLYG